jgi:hypothetical protein
MRYFLLVYDRAHGKLLDDLREYPASERHQALQERFRQELAYRNQPDVEVVVLGAESREALKRTHSRYFKTIGELASAAGC